MCKLKLRQIEWIAGLLEGEGSFTVDGLTTPRLRLGMTDLDVVERAQKILHTNAHISIRDDRRGSRKRMYNLDISGTLAASWMMILYPLMGDRRQQCIHKIIRAWRAAPFVRRRLGVKATIKGKSNPEYHRLYYKQVGRTEYHRDYARRRSQGVEQCV